MMSRIRGVRCPGCPKLRDSYPSKESKYVRHLWMD